MKRLMVIGLVTCMAAGAANAQMVAQPVTGDWEYTPIAPRGPYAYLEDTWSNSYMPAGNYGFMGVADDIHFGAPIHMTDFHVTWYSRITAPLTPLTMDVCFYAYDEVGNGIYIYDKKYCHYTVTGLGTGLNVTDVDVAGPCWLPCDVWMQVCFRDVNGNPAVDTGVLLAADNVPEVGNPSYDFYLMMNSCCEEPPSIAGLYWFGGYTPDLPGSDPYWNPCANYTLGVTVPEPLTLGLVALGGLLAIRRRR